MEEPIQVKAEPIEFWSYSLQSSEQIEPKIKSEPMEFQSACSVQSSDDFSTEQNGKITEFQMDRQKPYPVMLHFAGSYELLKSNASVVGNEKEIPDTHLSETVDGLIKSELSNCDTEIVKAEEEFQSDKDIYTTSDYYGKDMYYKSCDSERDTSHSNPNNFDHNSLHLSLDNDVYATKNVTERRNIAVENSINGYDELKGVINDHTYSKIDSKKLGSTRSSPSFDCRQVCLEHSYSELSEGVSLNRLTAKSSSVTEGSVDLKNELDTCVDDLESYIRGYKIHSHICDIQELINNREIKDDLYMELKLKGKSHCLYIDRSKEGIKKLSVSCGYCSKSFSALPDFMKHFDGNCSFKNSNDMGILLIDRSDPYKHSIKRIPGIYLLPQCLACQQEILEGKGNQSLSLDRMNILKKMPTDEQFICKCKSKIGESLGVFHGNTDKPSLGMQLVKQISVSVEQPFESSMHFICVNYRGPYKFVCGICDEIFHSVPLFTQHISFGSCEDKVKNIPFFLTSKSSNFLNWKFELDNTNEIRSRKTGFMCRHCIRTFAYYGACFRHGQQCDFIGKYIPNVEFALLKTCSSCKGKQIPITDRTDALRELVQQFEVIYTRLNKKLEVCDRSNIKCRCNQLHIRNPQIKTIAFELDRSTEISKTELDATFVHIETQTNKNLDPMHDKKENVEINKGTTEDNKEGMMEFNEGTSNSELDNETVILRKVETVLMCCPGASVKKIKRKIQIGTTCSEEICCCENMFAYHIFFHI